MGKVMWQHTLPRDVHFPSQASPGLESPNSGAQVFPPSKPCHLAVSQGTRKYHRISSLGGSIVHAGLPVFPFLLEDTPPNSRPFTTRFLQVASVASGESIAGGMAGMGLSEKVPWTISRGSSQSHT